MSIFNADFYPTPPEVAAEMLDPLDLRCRTVLEPSAGKGDYMLNRRFIRSFMAEPSWRDPSMVRVKTYGSQRDEIRDLIKALCFITGRPFEDVSEPECFDNLYVPGEWYDWGFFRFKAHKKGTIHFEFKDEEVWAAVNARYARIKGQVLPEQHRRPKARRRAAA